MHSATKVEFYDQAQYDLWLASKPDFSRITHFVADNAIKALRRGA